MSFRPENRSTQIAVSMGTLMDTSSRQASIRSMCTLFESHIEVVTDAGLDGIQWIPFKFPVLAGAQIKAGFIEPAAREKILVAEQSFRSETSLRQAWAHPNRQLALSAYVTMEERVASLRSLDRLQKFLGRKLPIVLYPRQPKDKTDHRRFDFGQHLFQPTQTVIDEQQQSRYSMISPYSFLDYARIIAGFTGYAVDTYHLRRDGQELASWRESLPQLLPLTRLVHVSVGRSDQALSGIDTRAELVDLLEGTEKTDLPNMLKTIRDRGWRGTYVIEAVPAELYTVNAQKRRVPENNVIGGSLQLIGHNLRKLI